MKNPTTSLILALIPGLGHIYSGKIIRGIFYLLATVGSALGALLLMIVTHSSEFVIIGFFTVFIYFVSLIDMLIVHKKNLQKQLSTEGKNNSSLESERFYTIMLSLVPGLGHFQLGLMNRGVTLLAAFLGLAAMVFFVAVLTDRGEFLVFLAVLPVIWVYGFFDAIQQLNKKQNGEQLVDRTILEELELKREDGKRSKAFANFLSIFPGAGHMYLGLQRRGLQLMAAFLFSIYILDVLRLGVFLFFIPIIWFYSFFDGLQKSSKYGEEKLEDEPIIPYLINHQRWIGIGLLMLGLYYLVSSILIPAVSPMAYEWIDIDLNYWFDRYFQTAIVCILLIGGGVKLLMGNKSKRKEEVK